MSPSNLPRPTVIIEYDSWMGVKPRYRLRNRKEFQDMYKARQFWIQKDKAGRNPKIVKGELLS